MHDGFGSPPTQPPCAGVSVSLRLFRKKVQCTEARSGLSQLCALFEEPSSVRLDFPSISCLPSPWMSRREKGEVALCARPAAASRGLTHTYV